jgi:1,4-dihydroxy-2-naphthoyl-CoA hydrolase
MTQSPFRQRPDLDRLNAANASTTLMGVLGIELVEQGDDFLRGRMPVDARTHQPYGLLHGGASVALAETLGSFAGGLCVEDARVVGIEINANHLRAVTEGWVIGTARPLHLGRSTQVWEIRIEDEDGRLVCVSRLTLVVVGRADAPPAVNAT